jgi:hypothetical protein
MMTRGGPRGDAEGEHLYLLPPALAPLEAVRGSILLLDWQWLRSHDLLSAYEAALEDRSVLEATAAQWVSFPQARFHWRALDALDLPGPMLDDVGRFVGEHVHGAFLTTLVRLAGQLGVSPWSALGQTYKLWTRSWRGGGVVARRVAEQAATLEIVSSAAIVGSRFFRGSFRGAVAAGIAPLCKRALVVEREESRSATSVLLRVSWV